MLRRLQYYIKSDITSEQSKYQKVAMEFKRCRQDLGFSHTAIATALELFATAIMPELLRYVA